MAELSAPSFAGRGATSQLPRRLLEVLPEDSEATSARSRQRRALLRRTVQLYNAATVALGWMADEKSWAALAPSAPSLKTPVTLLPHDLLVARTPPPFGGTPIPIVSNASGAFSTERGPRARAKASLFAACRRLARRTRPHWPFRDGSRLSTPQQPLPGSYGATPVPANAAHISLNADQLSLPSGCLSPIDLLISGPADVRDLLQDSDSLFLPLAEVRPVRMRQRVPIAEYHRLLDRLLELNMIEYVERTPGCVTNGVFAVPKSGTTQRLIVNAVCGNAFLRDPPPIRLPNPGVLASVRLLPSRPLFIANTDLADAFHHLQLPHVFRRLYCLAPDARRPGLLPRLTTAPMGAKHSPFLMQRLHESILDQVIAAAAQANVRLVNILDLPDGQMTESVVAAGVYLDDLVLFSHDLRAERVVYDLYHDAVEEAGLVIKTSKSRPPSAEAAIALGYEFCGDSGWCALRADRMSGLIGHTVDVLAQRVVKPRDIAALVGQWIWACLACRPALAVLGSTFRFVECARRHPHRSWELWPGVRMELSVLVGLAPLLAMNMRASDVPIVVATDASLLGEGVSVGRASPLSRKMGERLHGRVPQGPGPAETPVLVRQVVDSTAWHHVVSFPWMFAEPSIAVLELHAVRTAIRRVLSVPLRGPAVLPLLCDNVVCVGLLRKGRTSSRRLLRVQRPLAALLLGHHLSLRIVWVGTAHNPADEPSRKCL